MNDEEKQKNYRLAERLLAEQNFSIAVIAGAVAMLLAAAAYGITVAKWAFSYGFAAAAIGIFIGLSMQFLGRGIATKFTVVAAAFTITGCILGSFCRVIVERAVSSRTSPIDVLRSNSLSVLAERAASYFSLIDLVYWFVAVFFAVFLARRSLSRAERLAIGLYEMQGSSNA